MSDKERDQVRQLLNIWKDLFNSDAETMPVTDLVVHTILSCDHIHPHKAKEKLSTTREVQWQRENIPKLLRAGVISYCDSS